MKHSLRGSLRLRLTVAFSLIFLVAGLTVLAGSTILVGNSMSYTLDIVYGEKYQKYSQSGVPSEADFNADLVTQNIIRDSMRGNLLTKGGLTVLAVWIIATAASWFLAGRLLKPLNMITATAQQIAGRSLHRRIALDMPPGEVKSLADSFDSMLDRLDESFAGQGRFIANAAHELKTPLTVNRTLVEVAMNRPGSPPEIEQLGVNLLAVNQRHERLIDALLILARAEETITSRAPVGLADLAASVIETTRTLAEEHGVRVEAALAPALAVGDPILLEQLIRNLVDNAIRYNVPGGWVRVSTAANRQHAEITVSNTGAIVSPYEIPALFEPFRRLTDRVGSARGSGLGLSIVRAVAQAHRGGAAAAPRPGGGLVVHVVLPVVRVAHPQGARSAWGEVKSEPVAGD